MSGLLKLGPIDSFLLQEEYVDAEQEAELLKQIYAPKARWVQLKNRRLQNHGGLPASKGMILEPMPPHLAALLARVAGDAGPARFPAPPNHVLVNEYLPKQGIFPHEDGPLYHPTVAILSLGAGTVLRFWPKPPAEGGSAEGGSAEGGSAEAGPAGSAEAGPAGSEEGRRPVGAEDAAAGPAGPGPGSAMGDALGSSGAGGTGRVGAGPPALSVVLPRRSLILFADNLYTEYLHGIDEVEADELDGSVINPPPAEEAAGGASGSGGGGPPGGARGPAAPAVGAAAAVAPLLPRGGTRVSLTCRHVLRTRKSPLRL